VAVAELASAVGLPMGVVHVLLDDLLRENLIEVKATAPRGRVTDMNLLRQVLNGLQAL
jgi:DNA-binding IclR family transcriptional regulator